MWGLIVGTCQGDTKQLAKQEALDMMYQIAAANEANFKAIETWEGTYRIRNVVLNRNRAVYPHLAPAISDSASESSGTKLGGTVTEHSSARIKLPSMLLFCPKWMLSF